MIEVEKLLDDVALAEAMLAKQALTGADIVLALRLLLKMKYYPVAVKFFYESDELEAFRDGADYRTAVHPLTLCHFAAGSRQGGHVLLAEPDRIGCANARYVLGWKEFDRAEIKSHVKYTRDEAQAERFLLTKNRMPPGLLAVATAPLHLAPYEPDVVQGMSDVLQAYHLGNDWCAAFDIHPFRMTMTMNSAVCHGIVSCHLEGRPNITPMCSGSYTAGKTEQGEINWIWPGDHLEPTVRRLLERTVRHGSSSFPRTGEPYPGFDLCKLCPYVAWVRPRRK